MTCGGVNIFGDPKPNCWILGFNPEPFWSTAQEMEVARDAAAWALEDDFLFVMGGSLGKLNGYTDSVEMYSVASGECSVRPLSIYFTHIHQSLYFSVSLSTTQQREGNSAIGFFFSCRALDGRASDVLFSLLPLRSRPRERIHHRDWWVWRTQSGGEAGHRHRNVDATAYAQSSSGTTRLRSRQLPRGRRFFLIFFSLIILLQQCLFIYI